MKKATLMITILMALSLILAACTTPAATTKEYTVGVSMLTRTHTFYKLMEEALVDEATKQGVTVVVVDANMDEAAQLNQVQDFITQKVDAILLTAVNTKAVGTAIKLANDAGIPVFTMDNSTESGGVVVSHVATDNYAGGVLVGEYAAEVLDGKGEVAIIGCVGYESIANRTQGFQDAVEDTDIEIVAVTDCKCDGAVAASQTQDLLVTYPDLALIFGTGDPFALGAMTSITAANEDVYVIGLDGLPEGVAEVKKGGLFLATVAQDPDAIARTSLQNIIKHLNGETVEALILISPYVIDKTNAE